MAVFFMLGRKNYRNYERFECNDINAKINYKGHIYDGKTIDISEGGFGITVEKAAYFPYRDGTNSEVMEVNLTNEKYTANVSAEIVTVTSEKDKGWKYSFQIVNMTENDKRQYMQLIYDREHTLPKSISIKSSVYGDMVMNIKGRVNGKAQSARKMARVKVNNRYHLKGTGLVTIINFNFENVYLAGDEERNELDIILEQGIIMNCLKVKGQKNLYKISNIEELMENGRFNEIVQEWENMQNIAQK
jgi:cellulose synthase (UDP-forming)